jgi:PIN domain nuclease of toxin-antitoxin system
LKTYITDTHSLLWAFTRPNKLGDKARAAFEEIAEGRAVLLIPVIVLAELFFTVENKPIQADLKEILTRLRRSPNVQFVDLAFETVTKLPDLTAIPEMHDRMIVAEALNQRADLITRDESITDFGLVNVVW